METRSQVSKQQNNFGQNRQRKVSFRFTLIAVLASAALLLAGQAAAAIAVVVAPDSEVSSMTRDQVKMIFLGKKKILPNGVEAKVANQPEESAIFDTFNESVLGKPSLKVLHYWVQIVFSGKGNPPQVLNNDAAVKAHVRSTSGGIGYIDSSSVDDSVKVVYESK